MKKFSVFLVLILCFCLCVTAYATQVPAGNTPEETTIPEDLTHPGIQSRLMGDVDGDGSVTAADARTILRCAVNLESIEGIALAYADMDFNGSIKASDARLALRTSVTLEEEQSCSFEITDSKAVSCTAEGFVKAVCAETGKIAEVTAEQRPHTFQQEVYCQGHGKCSECNLSYDVEVSHSFFYKYSESLKECYYCGYTESFVHNHNFSNGNCRCGLNVKSVLEEHIKDYVIKNGTLEDNMYYISEYIDSMNFAVMYDTSLGFSFAYYGFGVNQNGVICYYDFYFDFEENTIEALMYTEDMTLVAYSYGNVNSSKVDETANGDAITLTEYNVIPELNGYENAFRQMMEGAVYDLVSWLRGYLPKTGFEHTTEAFADFTDLK